MPTLEPGIVRILVIGEFAAAAAVLPVLLFVAAPYGRFSRKGWGPRIPARAGWFLMELPSLAIPVAFFAAEGGWKSAFATACFIAWTAHYAQRVIVYPLVMRGGSPMPASVALMAFAFNAVNAYANSWYLVGPGADPSRSLAVPAALAGIVLFAAGFAANLHSDGVLRRLRAGGSGYAIPNEGLHRLVASPNYLGEILEWTGFALLARNPAAWAFAAFTAANLVPRALKNRRWYAEEFGDAYPRERKAVIPFIL